MLKKLVGIEGLPLIDLEDLIDGSLFPVIDKEIRMALVKSTSTRWGLGGVMDSGDNTADGLILPRNMDALLETLTPELKREFDSLGDPTAKHDPRVPKYHTTTQAQRNFLKIVCGAYFTWQHSLSIRGQANFDQKDLVAEDVSPEIRALLPQTLKFIDSLPFESTARITVFGSDAFTVVPTHRDAYETRDGNFAEFMSITPMGDRKDCFYTYDAKEKKRYYAQSKVYWFNDVDYHGVVASKRFTYSLRIDGIFTQAFREKIVKKYPQLASILKSHPVNTIKKAG